MNLFIILIKYNFEIKIYYFFLNQLEIYEIKIKEY